MPKRKGFTLIELLVVIAIIGLLSTLAVVQLNSARSKSRDARRLSDVKQLSTILEMQATEGTSVAAITHSTGALCTDTIDNALTKNCDSPGQVSQFANFEDPSTPDTACNCGADMSATCGYSITKESGALGATVGDYQICFYLESGAGSLAAKENCITTGGQLKSGANNCL